MNKKLARLLQPGMGWFFGVLIAFCAAAVFLGFYPLAIGEAVATVLLFALYWVLKRRRNKEIQAFIQSTFNTLDVTKGAENPFPMVLIRLVDGGIVWNNDKFATMTGFKEKLSDQLISRVVPTMTTDWLASGKSEYPYDVTIDSRRYRVYGTTIRPGSAGSTMLGMLHFADLT